MKSLKILLVLLFSGVCTIVAAQGKMPADITAALKTDDVTKISSFVTKDNVNACYEDYSLLSNAVRYNAPKCFELILKMGADVNLVCAGYVPPLMHAAKYGHLDMAKMLVEKGADVNFKYTGDNEDKKGHTAITLAEKYKHQDIADYLKSVKK